MGIADGRDGYRDLVQAVVDQGFPAEFADQLARELRMDFAMRRLATYIRQARATSVEQIVDEMFAIIADRDAWLEQKRSEQANAKLTQFYNRPER